LVIYISITHRSHLSASITLIIIITVIVIEISMLIIRHIEIDVHSYYLFDILSLQKVHWRIIKFMICIIMFVLILNFIVVYENMT